MNKFLNLRVGQKITILSSLLVIVSILIGVVGGLGIRKIDASIQTIYNDRVVCLKQIKVVSDCYRNIVDTSNKVQSGSLTYDEGLKLLNKDESGINTVWQAYLSTYLVPREKTLAGEAQRYMLTADNSLSRLALILQNKDKNGLNQFIIHDLYKNTDPIINKLSELVNLQIDVSKQEYDMSNMNYRNTIILFISFIVFGIAFAIFTSIALKRLIARPLTNMSNYLEKIAEGDLSETTLKEYNKSKLYKDEIGEISKSILEMRKKLSNLMLRIIELSEHVASSSQELTANSEQTSMGTEEIAKSVLVIADGTNDQLKSVSEASNIVENMSVSIEKATERSVETANSAEQTLEATHIGEKAIQKTKEQMDHIEKTVLGLDQVIRKLENRSKEISQIVDAISNIAEQTNLLALNAAIEAARAGEQGKGFAVVADEVRKLAEESQKATKQISELISQIQADTNSAVYAMKDGTDQVKIGMDVMEEAGNSFETISNLVSAITKQIQDISDASKEMFAGSQMVVKSVDKIEKSSKEASEQSQAITASVEEQTASMQEIAISSEALSKIAENLITEVNKFKV